MVLNSPQSVEGTTRVIATDLAIQGRNHFPIRNEQCNHYIAGQKNKTQEKSSGHEKTFSHAWDKSAKDAPAAAGRARTTTSRETVDVFKLA
jgi:hypothetical protein